MWISESVRPEHESALSWLNDHTDGSIHFFALEVSAVRIDASRPAAVFQVRVRPNDWEERARKRPAASSIRTESLDDWTREANDLSGQLAAATALRLIDHWRSLGGEISFGSGSVFLTCGGSSNIWPAAIYSGGKVEIVFQHLARRAPFDRIELRRELLALVNSIPGITVLPSDVLDRRPGIPLAELSNDESLHGFLDVLTWFWAVVANKGSEQ